MPTEGVTKIQVSGFTFEPFDAGITTWQRWVRRFETALDIFECESAKKKMFLLHYMGAGTYDMLCDKLAPVTPEESTYERIVNLLSEHFNPKPNVILENYRFNLCRQKENETCAEYLINLRRLAANCDFGEYLNTALRNQFVFGLKNSRIQSRLLEKADLTLQSAINTASIFEAAERGGMELHQGASNEQVVDMIVDKRKAKKAHEGRGGKACFRCGSEKHLANQCNHKETVCYACKKKGHLRRMCLKTSRQLNLISDEECEPEGTLVEEMFPIYEGHVKTIQNEEIIKNREKIFHKCNVNGIDIKFEIDTGAPVSIISLDEAKKYFGKEKVYDTDTSLYSYCNTPLDCVGYIQVMVVGSKDVSAAKLYIVKSQRNPLLGREWLRTVPLDWADILKGKIQSGKAFVNNMCISELNSKVKDLIKKFSKVFSSTMGRITGYQARLPLTPGAVPKIFKPRKVPFSLMQQVEDELERLVQEGLLKPVSASDWATPIVVVPKKDTQVRLCGDYKITINPVLKVDEYPLPSVDELFSCMAGGDKFTKLDLSKAYLQLKIHPEDRHVLTLTTHKGLFQPTRLMFGVASAPAKWQQFMEQKLSGIPGVAVFLDDIRITANNDIEHIARLEQVLQRLNESNMRINLTKCEWMQDKIEYCGYVDIFQLALAVVYNGDQLTLINCLGLIVCLAGICCHIVHKYSSLTKNEEQNSSGDDDSFDLHYNEATIMGSSTQQMDDSTNFAFNTTKKHSSLTVPLLEETDSDDADGDGSLNKENSSDVIFDILKRRDMQR
ncbi:uncharacterized protein K02A2.6 isoform X1 [Haematobia irritans]|uniref:uncharacterized protein K02A2.6 isoform X1 n=1 Tax=Haematobia irritans TaxID=7368 RepID=UPI003F5087D5